MFYPASMLSWSKYLETSTQIIIDEYRQVIATHPEILISWPEVNLYTPKDSWLTVGLYTPVNGFKIFPNYFYFPKTIEIISQIPTLKTAGFSILTPGCSIKPHVGYTSSLLRVHLGLDIPIVKAIEVNKDDETIVLIPNCGLQIHDCIKTWEKGKLLVFDDTEKHFAWNLSQQNRIVLLLDIENNIY